MGQLLTRFLLILTGVAVVGAGVFAATRPRGREFIPTLPVVASNPTPVSADVTTVLSPDGKVTLIMREKRDEGGVNHTFAISGGEDGANKAIFSKMLPEGTNLTIPYNAFSPDNKYVFLKETGSNQTDYFVVSTAGTPFGEGIQSLDITGPFREKYENYVVADVTGWGGLNLVVINTEKSTGGKGPSFWFDVGSRSYIQLSHTF